MCKNKKLAKNLEETEKNINTEIADKKPDDSLEEENDISVTEKNENIPLNITNINIYAITKHIMPFNK